MRPAGLFLIAGVVLLVGAETAEAVVVRVRMLGAGVHSVSLERVDTVGHVRCTNTSEESAACQVPPRSTWRVVAADDRVWTEGKVVAISEADTAVSVSLWRKGDIVGRFVSGQSNQTPPRVTIRFSAGRHIGNDETLPDGIVECPVQDSRFRCGVPAGFLDLRIKASGYVAQYRWDAEVLPGAKYDAGEIKLAKGAAVVGRVKVSARGVKPAASITLTPQLGELADPHTARSGQLALSGTTNDRGFFHVDGVPPGNYVVTARQQGFATSRTTVRVLANVESELIEPLTLERPHGIDLAVSPPVDADAHPWRVRLQELGALQAFSPESLPAKYVAPGLYRIASIPTGSYQVSIENGEGETFSAEAIDVDGRRSLFPISLAIILVKGRLHLGHDPLSASIWFGGRHGPTTIRVNSDAKGDFRGFLPHTGKWQVEIESEEPAVRRLLRNVDVRSLENGSASLDLTLPATTLKGMVVGPEDEPMPAANVSAKTADSVVQTKSDSSGRFELRGLPQGTITLTATALSKYSSDVVSATLNEDTETAVEIHLRESTKVKGTVTSGGMGVPGATVMLWPSSDTTPSIKPVSTTPQGEFGASVPESTLRVNVIVLAPGFALYARQIDIQVSKIIVCELMQGGGSITIERKSENDQSPLFLVHNGVQIFGPILSQWMRLHSAAKPSGSALTVADLEPGAYSGCVPDTTNAVPRGARPLRRCSNVIVTPLGDVTMRLP